LCSATTATSFFSGKGTAENAWKAVVSALLAQGLPFAMACGCSCDLDPLCQEVLKAYGTGHIFGDILSMLGNPCVSEEMTFAAKTRVIMAASLRNLAWCYRCAAWCRVEFGDVDSSGSPCQDWSAAGAREGTNGKRIHCLLAWMRWHLVAQTPVLLPFSYMRTLLVSR